MKRSDFFIKLATGVLFLAIVSYIGVFFLSSLRSTIVTMPAVSYTFVETAPVQGYIVRTETVLQGGGDMILPVVDEGVRVAAGQAVAVQYASRAAMEAASEINAARLRIAQLENMIDGNITAISLQSIVNLSEAVRTDNFRELTELTLQIETYIFSSYTSPQHELELQRARLSRLERDSSGINTLYAPVSGVFSQTVDGFEHVGPHNLAGLTPSSLSGLFSNPSRTSGIGTLVTDHKWYYAAVMYTADASRLSTGRSVTVQFSGAYNEQVEMIIERIGQDEYGQTAVVFSSTRNLRDIVSLRSLRAEVIFGETSGIRVPKEAIHLADNGMTYVFIQAGVRAERVNVNILLESGDSYLVAGIPPRVDRPSPLRPGATLIVRGNNLEHGRIIG